MQTQTAVSRLETIGSAAAGIAHDLNNQLTLVLNYLDVSDVAGARAAAGRCCNLTSTLLAYSHEKKPTLQPLDPIAFVRNFLAELKSPAGVRIVVNTPESLPDIAADPLALHRLLTNLISNATSAMQGSGTLRIILRPGIISVEDTGPGIPPQNLALVFNAFFTTKGSSGTGLGLAIVRDVMRQHGGSVSVESKVGEGSRFRLKFRLTQ
ncbi:MAG: ATP-binding protein [Acidobacteriota bacterium]|nr:ATP-binding protein [Acidobacteriota bacterium]